MSTKTQPEGCPPSAPKVALTLSATNEPQVNLWGDLELPQTKRARPLPHHSATHEGLQTRTALEKTLVGTPCPSTTIEDQTCRSPFSKPLVAMITQPLGAQTQSHTTSARLGPSSPTRQSLRKRLSNYPQTDSQSLHQGGRRPAPKHSTVQHATRVDAATIESREEALNVP